MKGREIGNKVMVGNKQTNNSYQNTKDGFSVTCIILHSSLNVDPSSICTSGAPVISATASVIFILILRLFVSCLLIQPEWGKRAEREREMAKRREIILDFVLNN